MNELPRQTRNHSIDEPEPLPDLSAMPDPRGLQANSLQADTSLDNILAPGRNMLVNEPQPLPGVLPPSDAQKSADEFREFYGSLPFGMRLNIAEQGGLPSLATHFMQQRQAAAAKMIEEQNKQQQHVEDKILGVWQDHNMPLAQKKKLSEQYGRQHGSALGINLARLAKDDLVAKSEIYQKYLPPGKYEELRQILKTPNADLAPVEHWAKVAEAKHNKVTEATVVRQDQSRRFAELLQQHRASPLDPESAEWDEFKELWAERKKREEEATKLNLEIQGLQLGQKKTQVETNILETKPTHVGDFRTPDGGIGSMFYDPNTKKTTERVGMPLQQTQDITAATKTKNAHILDNGENILGLIKQYRGVLRPENVGLLGDLRGMVYGAGQQADAFAQLLKGQANAVVDQLGQSGGTVSVSNFFDPKLSKSELLGNIITYQLAFINSEDGRVSNDDFKQAKQSLGLDNLLTGAGDISAKLDAFEEVVNRRMAIASRRLGAEQAKPPKFKSIDEYKKARGIK